MTLKPAFPSAALRRNKAAAPQTRHPSSMTLRPAHPSGASKRLMAALAAGALMAAAVPAGAGDIHVSPDQARALGLRTAALRAAPARTVATAPGVFAPRPQARRTVSPPFAGVVSQVLVVEGQAVRAGQTLAVMLSREAADAAAQRSQAAAELTLAQAEAARAAKLVAEGIAAGSRLEQANARLKAARAMAASRAAGGAGASASGQYVLRAPFAGRVAMVEAEAGQGLQALAPAFVVDKDGPIQVQANLPAAFAGQVRPGDAARVEGAPARVVAVGSVIDPKTRAISLRVETAARPDFIAGRAARVEVLSGGQGLLEAPRTAVARVGGRPTVFAASGESVRPVPVEVVSWSGDTAVLRGPLKAGQPVAVAGVSELQAEAEK
jgi:cobalt-zinc-cadmium efflux system membrane fusion protein